MIVQPLLILLLAVFSEIIATTSLKLSEGFTKPLPAVFVVLGYGAAFYFLSLTLKNMHLGTAYAIWSGLGTAGAVIIGMLLWQEKLDGWRIIGIALIVIGVIVLNLFAEGAGA
jgi:multidrug transporter EmrE-like cation transporter